ncbi:MAG TPA: hypothetical protein VLJ38_10500, partial [Polyangiaceae bacterium]|nr:hypothetical protein [Polyangiaceae bacterium]
MSKSRRTFHFLGRTGALVATLLACASTARAADWDPDSEADNYARGWVRLDADRVGVQGWVGTTLPLGRLELAGDVVISQAYSGVVDPLQNAASAAEVGSGYRAPSVRLELGPALSHGAFFFLPKLGLGYDFERQKIAPFVPQLMTIIQGGPLYVESWLQYFVYAAFDHGSQDSFYTLELALVAVDNHLALGVQAELTLATANSPPKHVRSLPLGLAA